MRAYHKYHSNNKYRGKRISDREKQRRIAQSMGYRFSIMDMPIEWFAFMKKGGIIFENLMDQPNQMIVEDQPNYKGDAVETKTLTL